MPSLEIPCEDCEEKKKEIELNGNNRVINCEPVLERDGWCIIEWEEIWD